MRIASRFILFILFPIIVAISLSVTALFTTASTQLLEAARDDLEDDSMYVMKMISRMMFERISDVKLAAEVISSPDMTLKEQLDYLRELEKTYKTYVSFSIYDSKGLVIGDTRGLFVGEDHFQDQFFQRASVGDLYYDSKPVYDSTLAMPVLRIASPIYHESKFQGVLLAYVPISKINSILADLKVYDAKVDLVSEDGLVIYSNHDPSAILNRNVSSIIPFEIIQTTQSHSDVSDEFITIYVKEQGYFDYEGSNWILLVSVSKDVVLGGIRTMTAMSIIIVFVVIVSMIGLSIVFSKKITSPIAAIGNEMKNFSIGKIEEIRTNWHGGEELDSLAKSFNIMSKSLKESKEKADAYRDRLISYFETSPDGFLVLDSAGKIFQNNQAIQQLVGSKHSLKGNFDELFVPESQQKAKKMLDNEPKRNWELVLQSTTKDIPVLVNTVPLRNQRGEIDGYFVNIKDISEIIQAKRSLQESERKYRMMFEGSIVSCITMTPDGIITDCNDAALELNGYTRDEFIGRSVYDFVKKEHLQTTKERLTKVKNGHKAGSIQTVIVGKDKQDIPVLVSTYPLFDAEGQVASIQSMAQDMTEIHKTTKKLEERDKIISSQIEKLKQMDIQKDELIATASHELKTPLTAIKGYLEMLLDPTISSKKTPQDLQMLKAAHKDIQELESIINRILLVQKAVLQKLTPEKTKFKVQDLLKEVFDTNVKHTKERNISFSYVMDKDTNLTADRSMILTIFSELIKNAIDFVPQSNGVIEIGAKTEDKQVLFWVKDNGPGISPDSQKHLFDKFYQVDSSLTRRHGGVGIGLAICKELVESMQGKIWVDSTEGQGTTFFFTLPKS